MRFYFFLEKVILIQPRLVENSAATGVEQPRHQNLDEIYPFSESSQSSGLGYVRMCSCYNSIQPRMSYSATTGSFPHVSKFIQPRMSYSATTDSFHLQKLFIPKLIQPRIACSATTGSYPLQASGALKLNM